MTRLKKKFRQSEFVLELWFHEKYDRPTYYTCKIKKYTK